MHTKARPFLSLVFLFFFSTCPTFSQNWTKVTTPTPLGDLHELCFVDSARGWCAGTGESLIHTMNGTTFGNQYPNLSGYDLASVFFLDKNYGWVSAATASGSIVAKTTNGGNNWKDNGYTGHGSMYSLSFTDTLVGVGGGQNGNNGKGEICRTTDGGTSWTLVWSTLGEYVNHLQMVTGKIGYACTYWGTVLKTIDSGRTWTDKPTNYNKILNGIHFTDTLRGWAVGEDGIIIKTIDGGTTWDLQISGTSLPLNSVWFIDSLRGWTCGGSIIYFTKDGGENWLPQFDASPITALYSIQLLNSHVGYACGNDGAVYKFSCPAITTSITPSICEGDSVMVGSTALHTAGNYAIKLATSGGCDSIVQVTLTVTPLPNPLIAFDAGFLGTGAFSGYQWYYNGTAISGDTTQTISPSFEGNYSVAVTDAHGCTALSTPFVYTTTGIQRAPFPGAEIFPNPTNDEVTILIPNTSFTYELIDLAGRQISMHENVSGRCSVALRTLPEGLYVLKISTAKQMIVQKIMKKE